VDSGRDASCSGPPPVGNSETTLQLVKKCAVSTDKSTITLTSKFRDSKGKEITSTEFYEKQAGTKAPGKNAPKTKKE